MARGALARGRLDNENFSDIVQSWRFMGGGRDLEPFLGETVIKIVPAVILYNIYGSNKRTMRFHFCWNVS